MSQLPATWTFTEHLGVDYGNALLPVPFPGTAAIRERTSQLVFPVQELPAMAADDLPAGHDSVTVALLPVTPGCRLDLEATAPARKQRAGRPAAARVTERHGVLEIRNGMRAVRLPNHGDVVAAFPGPFLAMSIAPRRWFGCSRLRDVPERGWVRTTLESNGPCAVQWRTEYRWGVTGRVTFRVRWIAGGDTLLVEETIAADSAAAWDWFPLGLKKRAPGWWWGGGERITAMEPLTCHYEPHAHREPGRRWLTALGHVAYWNQWNAAWAAFVGEGTPFVGVFGGWGGHWQVPGHLRIDLFADDAHGVTARFPLRRGRRLYGLVFGTPAAAHFNDGNRRCHLNRRKVALSDFRLSKVRQWRLVPTCEPRKPQLVAEKDLAAFRGRLARAPEVVAALDNYLPGFSPEHCVACAAALWQNDGAKLTACARETAAWAAKNLAEIADGGYERLIIFDGRAIKRLAFDTDVLWAQGHMSDEQYQTIRRSFVATAYMLADPDYCRVADFYPRPGDGSGIFAALQDDMGDCPVPPNFLAEFFSTTGVVAELYPSHPESRNWRAWAMARLDEFLAGYFTPDGTYLESVNYHNHCFNELLCLMYPLWLKGVRDYFTEPRIKGSFRHFVEIQMPPIVNSLPDRADESCKRPGFHLLAAPDTPRAPMPADGNSGGHGHEQDYSDQLTLGAWVYRDRDPALAGQLMATWQRAGKPVVEHCHAVATLLTLDPAIPATPAHWRSIHRQSLGIFSKATQADGTPVWCLLRAGRATHHMDFDQGNLHLAYGDRVLLGDHGYHTCDASGKSVPACATHLHNTIVYSDNRDLSSGYTGLEHAPEPLLVHLGEAFDWCVHRIVNCQFRDLTRFRYTVQLPAPETRHVRHLLFVKPDYFLVWDVFAAAHQPSTFWLHPPAPLEPLGDGRFRTGEAEGINLSVQFLVPGTPEVIENAPGGPLWSFAVRQPVGEPYLALLVPGRGPCKTRASLGDDGRTVTVNHAVGTDIIRLPEPGSVDALPLVSRG